MATKEEIATAIKVINEIAGEPTIGAIAELVKELKSAGNPAKETRVVESKETR